MPWACPVRRRKSSCREPPRLRSNVTFGMVNGLLRGGLALGKFCRVDGCGGMNFPAAGARDFGQPSVFTDFSRLARGLQARPVSKTCKQDLREDDGPRLGRAGGTTPVPVPPGERNGPRARGTKTMDNALLVGLSRQVALGRELEVVANNLANINTTGYKADSSIFE